MSRIYESKEEISSEDIRRFFDGRATKESNAVNAVMLQSDGSSIAIERDRHEKENLLPVLVRPSRIMELGCGAGRIASRYVHEGHEYLGVDFSSELIARASKDFHGIPNVHFQIMKVPEISEVEISLKPPFDLFIVTGLLIYLNDNAVRETLNLISEWSAGKAQVYIRESISIMNARLTLKEYYSDELACNYNAIYRTDKELSAELNEALVSTGFRVVASGYAFPEYLRNRSETAQYYYKLAR